MRISKSTLKFLEGYDVMGALKSLLKEFDINVFTVKILIYVLIARRKVTISIIRFLRFLRMIQTMTSAIKKMEP